MKHKNLIVLTTLFCVSINTGLAQDDMIVKLDCEPAETRIFNYESDTKLWGPLEENFLISANVYVHCMEKEKNGQALKYMVEIKKLEPKVVREKENELENYARLKRSAVGDWVKNAWEDIKEFFVSLFTRSRGRFREPEFDIDDNESQSTVNKYQCKNTGSRIKRQIKSTSHDFGSQIIYDKMFDTPFEFVQSRDGTIVEIKFSDRENDEEVKNFKRHIADAFATQLNKNKLTSQLMEQSPIGEHQTKYTIIGSGSSNEQNSTTLKVAGPPAALSYSLFPEPIDIIRQITSDGIVQIGNGKGIIYDPSQIDIHAQQHQKIRRGQLAATSGQLSISLINQESEARPKRSSDAINHDLANYMKAKVKYSLTESKKISKRSTENQKEELNRLKQLESQLNFHSDSLISRSSPVQSLRDKLASLRESLSQLLTASHSNETNSLLALNFNHENPVYNLMSNIIDIEAELNEHLNPTSLTSLINDYINEEKINKNCADGPLINLKKCRDLILILIKTKSRPVFESLLTTLDASDIQGQNEILKLLVHTPKPTVEMIQKLLTRVHRHEISDNYKGLLLLTVSSLAFRSESSQIKKEVAQLLIRKIDAVECNENDHLLIDSIEAIGNLGHQNTIKHLVALVDRCLNSDILQIAAIHGFRKVVSDHFVQTWFINLLNDPRRSCIAKKEIVNILTEDINNKDMIYQLSNKWPKIGFNQIDKLLADKVFNKNKDEDCLKNQVIQYFERKKDDKAKEVLKKMKQKSRRKRTIESSFWNDADCKEWQAPINKKSVEDTIVVTSDKGKLVDEEQNTPFSKRRKCSATKRFGPKQAQAIFRADIINDYSGTEEKPEYKLLAKFMMGTHFLGQEIDIGKMFIYHRKDSSRAYVNLFGNTLVDAANENCKETTTEPYSFTNYLPLYDFNVWLVHMTMGIRLTGEVNFDLPKSQCNHQTKREIKSQSIDFTPEARVRAAGEASGKVLVVKGGVDIGGNFNYFTNLKFEPSPELCLSAFNGYKPMNVSIASWFQFWHPTCNQWMDRLTWVPNSLNWQIEGNQKSAWIENQCLIKTNPVKST